MAFTTSLANAFSNSFRPTDGANAYLKGQIAGAQIAESQARTEKLNLENQRAKDVPATLKDAAFWNAGILPHQRGQFEEYLNTGKFGPDQQFTDTTAPPVIQDLHAGKVTPAAAPEWFDNNMVKKFTSNYGAGLNSQVDGRSTALDVANAARINAGDSYKMENGIIYNNLNGNVDMANPVNRVTAEFLKAKTGTELAQGRNYDASARKSNAEAYQTNQGSNMVLPQGITAAQIMPALIGQESGGNPNAVSPKGAIGIAQIMPATRAEILQKTGIDAYASPEANRKAGEWYLGQMFNQFGDPQLGLAAYNAGPGAVQEALQRDKAAGGDGSFASVSRFLPAETRAYVPGVIARMGGFQLKQAKDQDAAATKAVNMTMPDWLRDQFSVQALDERGAPRIDTMSGKPIIDMAATNQRLNQLNAAWEAAGRPPIAEFAARFLVNGPKINQARLSNWGELPQAQPTAQASPMRQVVTMEEVVQTAANRGVSPELVIATLQQRGIQVAPPTAPPRVQAAPQPSAPAPAPAAPKPKPITDNGWKNRTYSDGSEKAKLPTLKLPDMFQLNIQPPQSVYDQKRAQNEQRAQQVSQQLLAKPFMFGG